MRIEYFPEIKSEVLHFIANRNKVSKLELQEQLHVTSSTLTRILQELTDAKLIVQSGYGPSRGGRKPILYKLNAQYRYFIGIDISRFYTVLGLFDMSLKPISVTRWRMDSSMDPESYFDYVNQNISSFCKDHQLSREQIIGAGVGAVGPLDRNEGIILNPKYYESAGWNQVNIKSLIEQKLGLTAVLDNGADCAAIGEQYALRMNGIDAEHMLYIQVGIGLRSAVISGGNIVQGLYDREGAFAQMIVKAGDPAILPGSTAGALENYVTIAALIEQTKRQLRIGRSLFKQPQAIKEQDVQFDLLVRELNSQNPAMIELFQQSAAYLGVGVSNLINTFQPGKVILGGALVNAYKPYAQLVEETTHQLTYNYPSYQAEFMEGLLMEDAVATGAALLVRNRFLQSTLAVNEEK